MSVINLENYRNGLIKGYELAYQNENWYEKNKNNFCDSIRKKYPNLIPKYAINSNVKNFLGFNPDDLIRFGTLENVLLKIDNKEIKFWIAKIPKGMSIYHSSRALGLNHSDFPLVGYSNNASIKENYNKSSKICPIDRYIDKKNICTNVSYYSTPYLTKGYLKESTGFGGNAVKYAYGITPFQKEKDNSLYNDRLRYNVNLTENEIKITEQVSGISAYKTKEETYLFIFGIDDILINRPALGKQNLTNFFNLMKNMNVSMNLNKEYYDRFLELIKSAGGIGTLQDNRDNLAKDYPIGENFDKRLAEWIQTNGKNYLNNPLKTAGSISKFPLFANLSFKDIPGIRFSTFEHDRPVMNMLSWLFTNYPTYLDKKEIKVSGFISSSLYVYSKGKGDLTQKKTFKVKELEFYSTKGYFHSELGFFFAPNNLERDRNNKYDTEYSINYLGIRQEYRKFKTTNLLDGNNSKFHQGHLMEHNTWTGLVASNLYTRFTKYNSEKIANKDIYLLGGYLHDLGKSGECEIKEVYANLNHQDPRLSVCNYIFDGNEIIGFKYHTLPAHPEEGYEYLKGYKVYKKFTLQGRNSSLDLNKEAQKLYSSDWERFFDHLKINNFYRRMIRIAVGAHWYFGEAMRKYQMNFNSSNKKNYLNELVEQYLRKIEIFYNDEFIQFNKEDFKKIVIFVIIISISDIFASEYDPRRKNTGLTQDEIDTLINYLPNISLNQIQIDKKDTSSIIVTKIIEKSIQYQEQAKNKQNMFEKLRILSETFIDKCIEIIDSNFKSNPNNNYSLLYNLKNSYPNLIDIRTAYPNNFPKAIVFDLDQTLLAAKFYPDKPVEYYIYPDTEKVINEVQNLRNTTKIVLITRHYSPNPLFKLLHSEYYDGKKNPIYYKNFDLIVARYTGPYQTIQEDTKQYPNFFQINGYPSDGFMMDNTGEYYKIPDNSKFIDIDKTSKNGHFDLVRKKFGIKYSDMINFDDDKIYFKDGNGLGSDLGSNLDNELGNKDNIEQTPKDIFVAGVLTSPNIQYQGIKYNLFKDGMAFYVFNSLNN